MIFHRVGPGIEHTGHGRDALFYDGDHLLIGRTSFHTVYNRYGQIIPVLFHHGGIDLW